MRIKEVEAQTGLTAKAIRLYESKGLLAVARESENDYRDYTQEDVKRLKTIALLRKLDVPVKTIKDWTDGERTLQSILEEVRKQCQAGTEEYRLRKETADILLEILQQDSDTELSEAMEDVSELQEALRELEKTSREYRGNMAVPVLLTVESLGPVGMTVVHILTGQKDEILLGFLLSLFSVTVTAFAWAGYLKTPKQQRNRSGCLPLLLTCALAFVAVFSLYAAIAQLQIYFFVPDKRMIYLHRLPWCYATMVPIFGVIVVLIWHHYNPLKGKAKFLLWGSLTVVSLILLYGSITGVSVASETEITRYSFWNPGGKTYQYADIERVEAGFGAKTFGLPTRGTGEFYYRMTYRDGIVENWATCTSEWDEDTWQWMLRLDEKVMAAGAVKTSSEDYWEYCEMDKVYVDMLLEVIRNQ